MTTVTPGQAQNPRWLYWRVFLGGSWREDWAIRALMHPLLNISRESPEIIRWFFIRYFDERGSHLRVRVQADELDHPTVQRAIEPLFTTVLLTADDYDHSSIGSLVKLPFRLNPHGRHLGWEHAVYEPERAKYGGLEGVRIAEEAFAESSVAIVEAMTKAPVETPAQRGAIGMTLLGDGVAKTLEDPARRAAFWEHYIWYWSHGDSAQGKAVRSRLPGIAASMRDAVGQAQEQLDTVWRTAIERASLAVAEATHREARLTGDPELHLLHHLHMNNNRAGVLPVEEALLATMAATSE